MAWVGSTTLDAAEDALQAIERVRGRVLGVVLNYAPLKGTRAYSYHDRYRYEAGQQNTSSE